LLSPLLKTIFQSLGNAVLFCKSDFYLHLLANTMRLSFLLLITCMLLPKPANANPEPIQSCQTGKQALALVRSGKLQEATSCYETIISANNAAKDGNTFTNLFNLSLLYQKQGQYEKASEQYQQALKLQPTNQKTLINLGSVLVSLHKYEAAIPLLEHAATMSDCSGSVHFILGNAYSLKAKKEPKWWASAASSFEQAIKCSPQSAFAHFNLGVARDNLNQKELAEKSFTTALNLDPNILGRPDVAEHFHVGHARLAENKPDI
jgi:tetratricopeptide (TPR) repeat protein